MKVPADHFTAFTTDDDALVLASVSSPAEREMLKDWLNRQRREHPDTDVEVLELPVDDWTVDNLAERITEVRQLYLDTLKDWPHDELPKPELYKRKPPAKKAAKKVPAKNAVKKTTAKKAAANSNSKAVDNAITKKSGTKGRP